MPMSEAGLEVDVSPGEDASRVGRRSSKTSPPRTTCRLLFAVALLWLGACATHARSAAPPSDLEFRLAWAGRADLDLHVRSPLGKEVWYVDPQSASGGRLSEDCNVIPEAECAEPVEIIAWPFARAPDGIYQYWVRLMHPRGTSLPISFTVVVVQAGDTVRSHQAVLSAAGAASDRWTWTYGRP